MIYIPHLAQCPSLSCHLVKKGHIWDWRLEQQVMFEKARILMTQMKALGISHRELPFEFSLKIKRYVFVPLISSGALSSVGKMISSTVLELLAASLFKVMPSGSFKSMYVLSYELKSGCNCSP